MTSAVLPVQLTESFDAMYADAHGDPALLPWEDGRPHPALISWLNAVAPSLIRCGGRVAVVGCGLGDDARELKRRGYDVTAFDSSKAAVQWAQKLDPTDPRCYVDADVLDPPARWRRRFDLIVEVDNLAWLPHENHESVMRAIAELLSPHGYLLVITRASEESSVGDGGFPYTITKQELINAAAIAGLHPYKEVSQFTDDEIPPTLWMRAVFSRR